MDSSSSSHGARVSVEAQCTSCGQMTTLPFTPTPGRPVYCRACFAKRQPDRRSAGGPGGHGAPRFASTNAGAGERPRPRAPAVPGARKRMMAMGRKGHFMHDAKEVLRRQEGGMEDQHHRAFLEGLFARGSRQSVDDARAFLDEKLADKTITPDEHRGLSDLVQRYSFWR